MTRFVVSVWAVMGCAIIAVGAALVMKQKATATANSLKHWHEGPAWDRLFQVYDEMAQQQFGGEDDCTSRIIMPATDSSKSKWKTQIHTCGDPANPPVFFLHGASISSVMWGDWMIPTLKQDYYTVSVDFPCDAGRSGPVSGDATNDCVQTVDEIIDWFTDLKQQVVGGDTKVSLVGYSYGAFVSSQIAQHMSQHIDKVVLMAPAAVFAPLKAAFMIRATIFGFVNSVAPYKPIHKFMSSWFFGWIMARGATMTWEGLHAELRAASDNVGPIQLPVYPVAIDVPTLWAMNMHTPMLLVIGDEEVAVDSALAVKTAHDAEIATKLYQNSGHMLVDEYPRQPSIQVVRSFLATGAHQEEEEEA